MRDLPNSHLTQLFLFLEHLNVRLARAVLTQPKELSRPINPPTFSNVLLQTRKHLSKTGTNEWPRDSDIVSRVRALEIADQPSADLVAEFTRHLLTPAEITVDDGSDEWVLQGVPDLEDVGASQRLTENVWYYSLNTRVGFSTREVAGSPATALERDTEALYWDDFLDPIAIMAGYVLAKSPAGTAEYTSFTIQRWLRATFCIPFSDELKYALPEVCRRLNSVFFGSPAPGLAELHLLKSATANLDLLTAEIGSVLREHLGGYKHLDKAALGIYVLLRFTHTLRSRHRLAALPADLASMTRWQTFLPRQCFSALRAFDHAFLTNRLFASISEIPGLNFIFRGGILPRVKRGRALVVTGPPGAGKTVMALQKVTTVARRGGLGVYLSLEESYDLILDRLVAFNLADSHRFAVKTSTEKGWLQDLKEAANQKDLGLLYLVTSSSGTLELGKLLSVMSEAGDICPGWRWKAIVIDSVNAMAMESTDPREVRESLRGLVRTIEESRFLGIVIAEPVGEIAAVLPYLADTIINLDFDAKSRSIEVLKSRSQNYHPGRHPGSLRSGRGWRIYPSLSAIRSALRRKTRTTLSEERFLKLPKPARAWISSDNGASSELDLPTLTAVAEKSSTLVFGKPNLGKTDFALTLALSPPCDRDGVALSAPESLLLVNFKTSEHSFFQAIRGRKDTLRRYNSLKFRRVRWYSPGENIGGAHILADIRDAIRECRRRGLALERVVVDELESAERVLPLLGEEPLFWSTLVNLLAAEAITAVFVFGEGSEKSDAYSALRLEMDYILYVDEAVRDAARSVEVYYEKIPDRPSAGVEEEAAEEAAGDESG